eukprot:1866115-Alexandrium_andersonii.AAC.2
MACVHSFFTARLDPDASGRCALCQAYELHQGDGPAELAYSCPLCSLCVHRQCGISFLAKPILDTFARGNSNVDAIGSARVLFRRCMIFLPAHAQRILFIICACIACRAADCVFSASRVVRLPVLAYILQAGHPRGHAPRALVFAFVVSDVATWPQHSHVFQLAWWLVV